MRCDNCFYSGNVEFDACHICNNEKDMYRPRPKPLTNADRIRAMTDEELARWLSDMHDSVTCPNNGAIDCNPSCKRCWIDWLKQEVENDG